MKLSLRTILAFLVAPVSFGILLLAISLVSSSPAGGLWALQFSALVGYPVAIVAGIPLYLLLSRHGLKGVLTYSVAALFFSALLIAYFIIRPMISEGRDLAELLLPARLGQMAILVFACFLTVFVFWFIARPDRHSPSGRT